MATTPKAAKGKTLVQQIVSILKAARKPLSVGSIVERVEKVYEGKSKDLRNLVNVTLHTNDTFETTERGVYTLATEAFATV